nr:MAG TPA: hypothetical protein [Caudoviricetes sp.]
MLFSNYTIFLCDCKHPFYSSTISVFTYTTKHGVCCTLLCNKIVENRNFVLPSPSPHRTGRVLPTNHLTVYRLRLYHIKNKSGGAIPKKAISPNLGFAK